MPASVIVALALLVAGLGFSRSLRIVKRGRARARAMGAAGVHHDGAVR